MVQNKVGRRKGRRTKGYFYRAGRGWYTKQEGKFVPLTDQEGERYREEDTPDKLLKEAAARILVAEPKVPVSAGPDAEVGFICARYLDHLKAQAGDLARPVGKAKTYIDRGQTLFDFCYGLPGEFFCAGDKVKREAKGDPDPVSTVLSRKVMRKDFAKSASLNQAIDNRQRADGAGVEHEVSSRHSFV